MSADAQDATWLRAEMIRLTAEIAGVRDPWIKRDLGRRRRELRDALMKLDTKRASLGDAP